jgi:two-component system, NarL family, sensor kinase
MMGNGTNHPIESDTEKLLRRNRELSILNAIAEALNRTTSLDQALQAALALVADLLNLQTGWIWLLDEGNGESYLAASQNLPPGLANNPHLMEGSCYCLDTYRAGDLDGAANINVITCSRLRKLVDGTGGLHYHASIPLYAQDKQLGVLNVASPDWRELTPDDLRLLYTIGDLLSIAVERARLYARSAEYGAIEERNRLARELHDTLAQGLTAIILQLEIAQSHLESGDHSGRAEQALTKALALARDNLEEARRSVLDLRAAPLEGRRLVDALAYLAQEVDRKEALEVKFSASGAGQPLPTRVEAGLYRIAQEALANVVRHASARCVEMELICEPQQVLLNITDDGHGFDYTEIPRGRFGLVGLNERARLLGGRLSLETSPGKGTRVLVSVPLSPVHPET